MKKIIQLKLKFFAKIILKKYKSKVIGITGSVGKTSSREAIYSVLKTKFSTRKNFKNYNNEFGLPLTIIGVESPGRHILGWVYVFLIAFKLILFKDNNYPDILILEMGIDHPGDMDYLNSIVKCDIGVVTMISSSHLEFFKSVDKIQKEKGKLVENIKKNGWVILNYDNEKSRELSSKSKVKVLKYGFKEEADIIAKNLIFKYKNKKEINDLLGLSFKVDYNGVDIPVVLTNVISEGAIYASLSAIAVGVSLGMNLIDVVEGLRSFDSPAGRMKLIGGIKNTLIIDDTYNASPQSSILAIDSIKKIKTEKLFRKIAVFGEMLELGPYTKKGHEEVGEALASAGFDILITVGEKAQDIKRGALKMSMGEEDVFHFETVEDAGKFVQARMHEGDLILIKGSQASRMEKITKEIMADPLKAKKLLVRQEACWS